VAQPDEIKAAMEQVKTQSGSAAGFGKAPSIVSPRPIAENVAWQITFSQFITIGSARPSN
jgi:hypothetical protein